MFGNCVGVTTLEEGEMKNREIILKSTNVARMAKAREPEVLSVSAF
jgi:hypothetical protein